ncbi:MAG: Dipeptide transport system permease protein DppC [Clostridium sp.]
MSELQIDNYIDLDKNTVRKVRMNRRKKTLFLVICAIIFLLAVAIIGITMNPESYAPNYEAKRLAPSLKHLFGTDYLGRDMFARTIKGLSTSLLLGLLAATISAFIALVLGLISATLGGKTDKIICWFVDLFMSVPHIILLMLISFMVGRGFKGVVIGVAVTHWPNLTRVIRGEVMEIKNKHYVKAAEKLGTSRFNIAKKHIMPHVIPQFIIGLILLFPHAILHEAAVTFLGFGLSLDKPAIGIILSEAMKHISTGMWWLVFFPGLALLSVVIMFDILGDNLKMLIDPNSAHE